MINKKRDDVFYDEYNNVNPVLTTKSKTKEFLIKYCKEKELNMCRYCMHKNEQSLLMAMMIVVRNKYVYPPHRHSWKDETYTILEGGCQYIEYDKNGNECKRVLLTKGDYIFNRNRAFHAIIPTTDMLVFIEHTTGPFDGRENEYL